MRKREAIAATVMGRKGKVETMKEKEKTWWCKFSKLFLT